MQLKNLLQKGLLFPLGHPVESIAFFLLTSCFCYLALVLSSSTPQLPLLSYSNGSLYTTHHSTSANSGSALKNSVVFLKQVVISLPKVHAGVSVHGVLYPPVIEAFQRLQDDIFNQISLFGDEASDIHFKDLCWTLADGSCALYSPITQIFQAFPDPNPVQSMTKALLVDARMVEYGVEGLITSCDVRDPGCTSAAGNFSVVRADSLVLTLFFNFTSPLQRQMVLGWEKRLEAMRLDDFYSQDLSLYFQKVSPNGKVAYDILDAMTQLKNLFRVFNDLFN